MRTKERSISFIKVNFGPYWDNIAVTRRYIDNVVHNETGAVNTKLLSAGASELMENACKYSCYGSGYISVSIDQNQKKLKIQVQNIATSEAIKLLKKRIDTVSQGDAEETYMEMLLEAYTKEFKQSQLGLAKIRYECKADIQLEILDEIPAYLVNPEKKDTQSKEVSTARAISVSIESALM
ncbi:MAG: hypothetical protein JXJ04_18590 [Spirochaetales bacterium]|nr:hypothetical protein [Spirochaetales bacterium]